MYPLNTFRKNWDIISYNFWIWVWVTFFLIHFLLRFGSLLCEETCVLWPSLDGCNTCLWKTSQFELCFFQHLPTSSSPSSSSGSTSIFFLSLSLSLSLSLQLHSWNLTSSLTLGERNARSETQFCIQAICFHAYWPIPEVSLTSPKLTGDLKAFSKLPQLLKLHLQGTEVSGHLTTLKKLKLEDLDLSGTQVTGRLEDLQNMDLVRLKLSKTHVTGDLLELRKCWKLRQLDLSFTRVTGRLTKDWTGRGQHLETLQLRSSSVHFVPEGEDLMELSKHWSLPDGRSRLLPRLMTLDLTNCCFAMLRSQVWCPCVAKPQKGEVKKRDSNQTIAQQPLPQLLHAPLRPSEQHLGRFAYALSHEPTRFHQGFWCWNQWRSATAQGCGCWDWFCEPFGLHISDDRTIAGFGPLLQRREWTWQSACGAFGWPNRLEREPKAGGFASGAEAGLDGPNLPGFVRHRTRQPKRSGWFTRRRSNEDH